MICQKCGLQYNEDWTTCICEYGKFRIVFEPISNSYVKTDPEIVRKIDRILELLEKMEQKRIRLQLIIRKANTF